ncbi:FadR/GntR family transcriptional regulator [Paenibacillus abyssi]|uniref:GntR family transcriptional regulator n=1 Tax=Paenibacillus abyssi TaxID=1340531 RepID=A0A917G581_9BACL|nr:FadR/GntR family transcriptional regulator [Paenibacillus abyssi]GGG22446.1 GntR family transcriptional regulator [Paenibacillus abyssi]
MSENKQTRIFEQVLEQIHHYITSRNLVPGDKLMTEREMAAFLQVSRSSVREALRILEMFDVIESKPGEGTILKAPHVPTIFTNIMPFFLIPEERSIELLESRKVIETGLVKLAAERRKDEDIRQMQDAVERMFTTDDLQVMIQADVDFHISLAKAAYNHTLSELLGFISDLISNNLYSTRIRTHVIEGVNTEFARQHQAILQAIVKQDSSLAAQEMEEHIEHHIRLVKSLESKL